jgi:hypothetical protein
MALRSPLARPAACWSKLNLRSVRTDENGTAARAIREFDASLENLRPSTRWLYLAGAKALLRVAFPGPAGPRGVASYEELWARTRAVKTPKPARARPFQRFLESRQAPASPEGLEAVRTRVLEALDRANRLKNPSLTARRDAALVAALCAAPSKGNPRAWPQGCLALRDGRVTLWEREVQEPAPAFALRSWGHWRERLSRPDQRRLYRRSLKWAQSGLLFPGPGGEPLSRAAPHNALRRLAGAGGLTPEKVRAAFLAAGERLADRTV